MPKKIICFVISELIIYVRLSLVKEYFLIYKTILADFLGVKCEFSMNSADFCYLDPGGWNETDPY